MTKKLFILLIAAFFLRLIALNQSLWLDEAISANVAHNYSYLNIVTQFSPSDFHPPLFYLLLKLWTSVFGFSVISLRFPSLLFSLAAGAVVYFIGHRLKGEAVGFWAAAFFLFNPLVLYYSQEARMYALVTFFLTCCLYYFLQFCHPERIRQLAEKSKDLILFNLFSFLSFLTFYGSAFLLAAFYLYLLFTRRFKLLILLLPGLVLAITLVSPLLLHQLVHSQVALKEVVNWSSVLGQANLKNLFLIPLKFSVGHLSFYPKWLYYLISGIFSLIVFLPLVFSPSRLLKFLFGLPLLLAFIVSFHSPMLDYFRYLYLIPILSLLLALSMQNKPMRSSFLAFGFLTFGLIYLFFPQFHREDWQSLAKSLPSDTPVYLISSFSDPLRYYRSDLVINDLRSLRPADHLIIIPYGVSIFGLNYRQSLTDYHLQSTVNFNQLFYETWQKN